MIQSILRSDRDQQHLLSRPDAEPFHGAATAEPGERLEAVVKRADLAMLAVKRQHYMDMPHVCRRPMADAPPISVAS